jgi:hypothetical protein
LPRQRRECIGSQRHIRDLDDFGRKTIVAAIV